MHGTHAHVETDLPEVRLVDLFAGCGGISCGFRQAANGLARLTPVAAVELDPSACATYAANFGDHLYMGDIAKWLDDVRSGNTNLGSVDIIVGGPPCQGFSKLGKQDPKDPRNKLWRTYIRTVAQLQPYFFVMENVPQFLQSAEYRALLKETRPSGLLAGYSLQTFVLSADKHGVAQKRRRAIVVGRRDGLPEVKIPEEQSAATLRAALKGLSSRVPQSRKLPERKHSFREKVFAGPYSTLELHVQPPVSARMREMIAYIKPRGNRHDLPAELQYDCWKAGTYGGNDVMGRLDWDAPSVTIRTQFYKPDKGRYIHPTANRPLTYAEAAAIQGFPADYLWCGSRAAIAKQIGNAVPVPLAKTIGAAVIAALLSVNPGGGRQ
jgi:DNA (cytosine-5)-methyltransferase 1